MRLSSIAEEGFLNRKVSQPVCGQTEEFGGGKALGKDFCPREGDFHVIGS